ncbi:dihydrofolate reductase family protein [Nocardia sp. NPDC088792]|uniref:dihydrofolate reductase family protein n=1 Tax=Nocardia sp. NPDC088792 TaxID=3364332 RepID=UPI0037FAB987
MTRRPRNITPSRVVSRPWTSWPPTSPRSYEKEWRADGRESFLQTALDQAREAAGDRDVRIAGGGATILEYVNAGLVDEFSIALSPVLFGSGVRLFEGVDATRVALEQVRSESSPRVTHLTYTVRER